MHPESTGGRRDRILAKTLCSQRLCGEFPNSLVTTNSISEESLMAEAYRLYAGTQAGMILFRGVGDIWTSMRRLARV